MRVSRRVALAPAVLVLLGGFGVAIPKLMSDGATDLPAAQQRPAEEVLLSAATCVDNPIQSLYTFRLRVSSIVPDVTCTEPSEPPRFPT